MTEEKDFINSLSPANTLGATFVLAGIFVYIITSWHDMNALTHVIITMGTGFIIYSSAITLFINKLYLKAVSPLLFIGAFLELNGFSVIMDEYFNDGTGNADIAHSIFLAIIFLQQAANFAALRIPVLLLIGIWSAIAFSIRVFEYVEISENSGSIIIGTVVLLATTYFRKINYPRVIEISYLFGSILLFVGAYNSLGNNIFFLILTSGMIYLSVAIRSTQLLVTSVIATLAFIGYFTAQNFKDSDMWPLALIILGILFFAVSIGALRIKKKYM